MNKTRVVQEAMSEYTARLGIPAQDVITNDPYSFMNSFLGYEWERYDSRCLGVQHYSYVTINIREKYLSGTRRLKAIRNTVAHEVIHKAFPHLHHTRRMITQHYEDYVEALQDGNMIFDGHIDKFLMDQVVQGVAMKRQIYGQYPRLVDV